MKGLFGKLFGSGSKDTSGTPEGLIGDVLNGLFEKSGLSLSHEVKQIDDQMEVEIFGEDEEMLVAKDGQLLDAIQLFLKRVSQHQLPDERLNIIVDSDGFREKANQNLIDLAEKLKKIAISKGKPVYFRALPPRDRKIIHQYLAEDEQVKSRSVGDGLFKKIKIYPVRGEKSELAESTTNA